MYTVIGSAKTRAMRVYWMLEELGLDYDINLAPPRSEAVRAVNPTGKVPCLLVDDTPIYDSVAIMPFLADRHNALPYPAGTIERAIQDSYTQFCVDEIEGALWMAAKNTFIHPEELRVPAIKPTAKHEFATAMQTLAERLGDNEFVMGDKITVPDILLGHCASWAKGAKFDLPEGKAGDYFTRLLSRPALKRAIRKTRN